jgi:DnaA family protein
MRQLTLDVRLPRQARLEEFVPGPNAEPLRAARECAEARGDPYVYLWGGRGTGKTHLLLGACAAAGDRGGRSLYLGLSRHHELGVEVLGGLERLDLLCVDDLQAVAGADDWERALFDLFNRLREAGTGLLVTADRPAGRLPVRLPDLRSRLGWGPGFRLRTLDDGARLEWLKRAAGARGMRLGDEAARFILSRWRRDLHSLEALLERLDQASLREQKRPTISLIQRLIGGDD